MRRSSQALRLVGVAWLAVALGAQVAAACACGGAERLSATVAPCHGEPTQALSASCCCAEARAERAEPVRTVAPASQLIAIPIALSRLPEPGTSVVASVEMPESAVLASIPPASPLRL